MQVINLNIRETAQTFCDTMLPDFQDPLSRFLDCVFANFFMFQKDEGKKSRHYITWLKLKENLASCILNVFATFISFS